MLDEEYPVTLGVTEDHVAPESDEWRMTAVEELRDDFTPEITQFVASQYRPVMDVPL